jgi:DNA-binding transcriptional LysR family regulator
MDLRRLQVFSKVYEHRSFSRAAEAVLLSQPTVSGHIKTLEDELGIQLFDRLGREIMPTKAAELLYDYARRILAEVDEAQQAVDAFLGRLRGELKVGGSTIPGQYVLPTLIGNFRALHPQVQIVLAIGDTGDVTSQVLSGEQEVGVVGASTNEERLAFTPLMNDQVCLVAWPGHPLAGREVGVQELSEHSMILREAGSGTQMFVNRALKRAGLEPAELELAARMGSTMAVIQGVRAKVGLGFISHRAVREELEAGRLVEIPVKGLELRRQFYLTTRRNRSHSPAAQAFMNLCLAELTDEFNGKR